MSNIKQNIDGHNKSILAPKPVKETQVNNCNCRKPTECPIPKNFLTESIVYQATVTTSVSDLPKHMATTKKRYSDTTIQRYTEPEPRAGAGATRKLFKLTIAINHRRRHALVIVFSGGAHIPIIK